MSELTKDKIITIAGKEYRLKFNFKAILYFEKITGKNFFKMGGEFSGTDTIALLCSCLNAGGAELSLEAAAELIDFDNINEISAAMQELTKSAMPAEKKGGKKIPLEAKPQN